MRISSKFFNKKGVSPLIATVLLISFAVALGSVVLNWSGTIVLPTRPDDKCIGINIKLRAVDNFQACYSGSGTSAYIKFIIDNAGSVDVDGLGIWITGEKDTKLLDFNDFSIKKGELLNIKDKSVKYDFNAYGAIKNIQFFPKIKFKDSIEICPKNSIKADSIGACST